MKKLITLLILLLWSPLFANNFGQSTEGDSTIVTYTHQFALDSAWITFAFGYSNPYDSVKASPITGSGTHKQLKSTYLNLDSIGTHYVMVKAFIGGAIVDTVVGVWLHEDYARGLDSLALHVGRDGVSTPRVSLHMKQGLLTGAAGSTVKDKIDSLQLHLGKDGQSTPRISVHMKMGLFAGSAGNNLEDELDSLQLHVGKDNQSTPRVSLHMKTGLYSGAAGDNIEDNFDTLFADIEGLTGGGTEPETLIVLDTADTTQVSGARVTVRTIDQSTVKVDGLITDVNGKLILDLDADSFFVATVMNNYQQALDTIVVAAGGQTDTIWVVPIDPAAATAPNMCNVYFDTWAIVSDTIKGAKLEATVYDSKPPYRDSDSSVILIPRKIIAYTNSNGRATISLVRSSEATDITGNNVTYTFTLSKSNYFKAKFENRTVPDASSWKGR